MISRGLSLIRRTGVLNSWPSPLVPMFLRQDNLGDDGHVAFDTSHGFPKFPKKYLGGDSVSGKIVHFWQFDSKSIFQKICWIWTLWCLSISHCTCEIRFRTAGVWIVRLIRLPKGGMKRTVSGDSVGEFRELDLIFMMWHFVYTYIFISIAFALVCLSHCVCHMLFLDGLSEACLKACQKADRL